VAKPENQKLDKWVGALIGAAAGDALGWPNEQNSRSVGKINPKNKEMLPKWARRDGGKFWSHNEEIYPGEYSDDTQLIIATARSLRYGANWSKNFTKVELPVWLSYERGGGGATKRSNEK
jgi:ADP-ribosylglycohydrolase